MDCTTAQGDNEAPLSMQTNSSRMVKAIRFCFRGVRGGRGVMGCALSALVALEELKSLQVSCLLAMLIPSAPPSGHILSSRSQPKHKTGLKQDLNFIPLAKFPNLETKLLQSSQ